MSAIEIAVEMYKREHTRWNQWAIFFFGSISAVFVAWSKSGNLFPFWVAAFFCSILSFLWVIVALSIRASTDAWEETIKELEKNNGSGLPFHLFRQKLNEADSQWEDLLETINIFKCDWWTKYLFSVTRVLLLVGLFLSILFLVLGILNIFNILPYDC